MGLFLIETLRTCANSLAQHLLVLIVLSFFSGVITDCFESAIITPIYKPGLKRKTERNRLLPVVPFLIEKILREIGKSAINFSWSDPKTKEISSSGFCFLLRLLMLL